MSDIAAFLDHLSQVGRAASCVPDPLGTRDKSQGADFDPVTARDLAVERALREAIEAAFPEDGIEGEEYGIVRPEARRRWLIDPIDGTRALICDLPSWTTLVALMEDGEPVAGLIDVPRLDERHVAAGGAAHRNGAALRVSGCTGLADARLSTTDPFLFDEPERRAFEAVRGGVRVTRYGLDALAYARLASGDLDLVIESGLKRHDWAALVPVVRGAGGVIGNWRGTGDLSGGDVVAAASEALYAAAVKRLRA